MQKKFYALFALLLLTTSVALAQTNAGSLKGKVFDKDTKESLPFVTVIVFLNGNTVNGGNTDIDGEYNIKPLEPGVYDVSFQFVGYQAQTTKGVIIKAGKITDLNAEMLAGVELTTVEVFDYKVPLIDKDGGSSGGTITREDLKNMPSRSVGGIATTVAGATGTDNGISIRGAREGSTWIYIDGIKVRGSSALPKSAIEEVSVITGGIPANIGDATGGVINVSLRNASSSYTGGIEAISSGFASGDGAVGLDHFGYNLIEGSLSGPLLFKKNEKGEKEKPLLGFFISGNYTDIVDDDPQNGKIVKIKDSVRQDLLANPIRPNVDDFGNISGVLYNADFLTADDFESVKTRMNARNRSANLVAKIDVNTADNMTLTLGGTAAFNKRHDYDRGNSLMNWQNNQQSTNLDWRAYAKFSQRFRNAEGEEAASSNLKNVYYSVMVDYSRNYGLQEDDTHGSDLFKYGHVGNFDIITGNTYEQIPGSYFKQNGFQDMHIFYTPSEYNPDLASINNQYFLGSSFFPATQFALGQTLDANGNVIRDRNQIFLDNAETISTISFSPASTMNNISGANGLRNGDSPVSTYGLWNYIGTQNNNYGVSTNNQFRVSGSGSADIGDHAIQIGFEYEQRKDAGYFVAPVGLWTLARLTANSHIEKVDNLPDANGVVDYDSTVVQVNGNYYVYYNTAPGETNQSEFDYNLRTALGLNPLGGDYLNVDNLDPEFLSIDMFNSDELFNSGSDYVTYYGYDAHGNKVKGKKPTIEDFFSETYKVGNSTYFSRPIGSFEPIYTSGFIMDKFAFDDLIFNVGVRVDRYDANQPVLKDPFVVGEAYTAGEVTNLGAHPSNIGSDFVVYTDALNSPTTILGYRDGNEWYNANGQLITDPSAIGGSSNPKPYLKNNKDAALSAGAFKDYKPAVNVMPRIAFSFPISDEATFFAHYDVLTQRPTEFSRFNPADYLNMEFQSNPLVANPALKPERTVDYALGFQQVLSKTSSIKIEAFYRELRNMIQIRKFVGAYPIAYRAFDNIDFGTVKGLTLTYDLRRTGNIRMNASYTLQFADGTGSTSQSQAALINAGVPNLRSINPFNYDQRHRIILTTDYRFGGGTDYNGPRIKDFEVLGNTGFNFICNLGSGTPYTPQQNATPITGEITPSTEGSINGARLPWQFTVDFNADRNFNLSFGKDGEKKKTANLNVYIWVTNLLNTRNVRSVHRFTGITEDDGYLAAAQSQQNINSQNSPSSFRNYYSMSVDDPNRVGQPRQIRLGVRFDF